MNEQNVNSKESNNNTIAYSECYAHIFLGDCLVEMQNIPDKSIDAIICDLPYGTTACKWDTIIPFEPLWAQYKRIIKDNGAIVLFGSEPFSSALRMSNIKQYKYDWKWIKTKSPSPLLSKKQPMRHYEDICIFYKKQSTYNPQMEYVGIKDKRKTFTIRQDNWEGFNNKKKYAVAKKDDGYRFPKNIIEFSNSDKTKTVHPTQKPVPLLEYLVKTYTNEGDTVLDNAMGSGSTGVACKNTNRNFIGIEKDENYFKIAEQRINALTMF